MVLALSRLNGHDREAPPADSPATGELENTTHAFFLACEEVDQACQNMLRLRDDLSDDRRRVVGEMPEQVAELAADMQDRLHEAAEHEATMDAMLASGEVERCGVCRDVLTPEQMAEHRADPPHACLRAAYEKVADPTVGAQCGECGELVAANEIYRHRLERHGLIRPT